MQTHPTNWETLLSGPHITEYKYVIDGVTYYGSDMQEAPTILKPLMDKPAIGRCCSGTLSMTLRTRPDILIPKAASVNAYCRLTSQDGSVTTAWVEQGHYYISKRGKNARLLDITCRDGMLKASDTYLDKTQFDEWPVPMSDVVDEIAEIMGVSLDSRNDIKTGSQFVVDRPNEDTLMIEVLSNIAAAHAGNFIMTEKGELRLVPFFSDYRPAMQALGKKYKSYYQISQIQQASRITLADNSGNEFTVGSDVGIELYAQCDYANQAVVNEIGAECLGTVYAYDEVLYGVTGTVSGEKLTIANAATVSGEKLIFNPQETADAFIPYRLTGAYLDPCIELDDVISINYKGVTVRIRMSSMTIRCSPSFTADVSFEAEEDDEDEFPYTDLKELNAKRAVTTHGSYFGNVINREVGFLSQQVVDGSVVSRLIANANTVALQMLINGEWVDQLFFDKNIGKFHIKEDVKVEGAVGASDLDDLRSEVSSDIEQTSTEIISQVAANYYSKGGTDQLISGVRSQITQAAGSLEISITNARTDANNQINEVKRYVRYEVIDGEGTVIVGQSDNPQDFRVSPTQLSACYNGEPTSFWDQNEQVTPKKLRIPEGGSLQEGSFIWQPRSSGNLSLMWVGD